MSSEVYNEFNAAVWMANKALDVAWADPDDDLRTVSRQFLRLVEQNASLKLDLQKQKEEIEQLRAVIEKLLPLGEFLLNDTWDKRRLPANTHGIIEEAKKLIKP